MDYKVSILRIKKALSYWHFGNQLASGAAMINERYSRFAGFVIECFKQSRNKTVLTYLPPMGKPTMALCLKS